MIDEKRLIERLWEQHKGIKANAECYTDAEEVADEICNVVSIIEEQPKVGEWIPCSERLPQEYENVLCSSCDGDVMIGRLYTDSIFGKLWGFLNNGSWRFDCIVAWQPLPSAYKGE